ncbi:MAG: hypothetical protein ACRC2T_03600 [Thermoguttaceae bacterium]
MEQNLPEPTTNENQGNIYDAFVKNVFGRVFIFADFLQHYADQKFFSQIALIKSSPL